MGAEVKDGVASNERRSETGVIDGSAFHELERPMFGDPNETCDFLWPLSLSAASRDPTSTGTGWLGSVALVNVSRDSWDMIQIGRAHV